MKPKMIVRSTLLCVLTAMGVLTGMQHVLAQTICTVVPSQVHTASVANLKDNDLTLDFAVDNIFHADRIRVDSIALYFYITGDSVKKGTIRLDTISADHQVKLLNLKAGSPTNTWYRISQKFGPTTKLSHFKRLILGGPQMHATYIALKEEALAPRLLVYGTDKTAKAPFQWLSPNGDARNSGRSSTFWGPESSAPKPSNPGKKLVVSGIAANTANVLYDHGLLEYMVFPRANYEIQRRDPFGGPPIAGPAVNGMEGFVTLKTVAGIQYFKNGNRFDCWTGAEWKAFHSVTTGNTNTFQTGPDGRIYVSDANFTAYSPYPAHRKLWTKGFGADNNKGCTLAATNTIGDMVYVYAWGLDSLFALDAATGVRRGAFKAQAAVSNPLICVGMRGAVAFYTGNELYFLSPDLRTLVHRITTVPGQSLSKAVCGNAEAELGKDIFLYLQGNIVRSATVTLQGNRFSEKVLQTFSEAPQYPIAALVADKSGNVYCIDNNNVFFSSFEAKGWATGLKVAQLIPGPDGSMYALDKTDALGRDCKLYALRFQDYGRNLDYVETSVDNDVACANALTLKSKQSESINGQHSLVATQGLQVSDNVNLGKTADITLTSGGTISFGKGFKVAQGATLKCNVGYK